jgi:FKBP-type peptidyl-prolyl cis-trans isomerase FkpA
MKINTVAGLLAALLIVFTSACKKGYKTTDDGLSYMYLVDSDTGEVAGEGGYIKFHLQIKTAGDSLINNTYESGRPAEMSIPAPTYDGCLFGGLAMLKGGDSVQFKVVADSFFTKTVRGSMPDFIKAGEELTITVAVLESKSKESFEKAKADEKAKETQEMQALMAAQTKEMEAVATSKGLKDKLQTLPSGVMYVKLNETNGPLANQGDIGQFFYKGTLLDGTVFDQNIGGKAFPVTIGSGGVIAGWLEVVDKIRVGEKWMIFVPSSLAYGAQGSPPTIGPNTPLIFEMELSAVKTAEQLRKEDEAERKKLSLAEKGKIAAYVKSKNFTNKITVDSLLLYYSIAKQGQGSVAKDGEVVQVRIKGFDLSGKSIEQLTIPENQPPFETELLKDRLFPALYNVITKMNKGAKFNVVTPSKLFQGEQGGGSIAPYTPVMFEIELLDIKPAGSMPQQAPAPGH